MGSDADRSSGNESGRNALIYLNAMEATWCKLGNFV